MCVFSQSLTTNIALKTKPECSDSILNYKNIEALLGLPNDYFVLNCNFNFVGKSDIFCTVYLPCKRKGIYQLESFYNATKKYGGKIIFDNIVVLNKGRKIKWARKTISLPITTNENIALKKKPECRDSFLTFKLLKQP